MFSSLFSSQNTSLNYLSKQLLPILPDCIPRLQFSWIHFSMTSCSNRAPIKLSRIICSFLLSFQGIYCCPSGEVINGFIMYESVSPSVCCLDWIARISSSFMPSILTVRRYDKAVPPLGFFPHYSKNSVPELCVSEAREWQKKALHPLQRGS